MTKQHVQRSALNLMPRYNAVAVVTVGSIVSLKRYSALARQMHFMPHRTTEINADVNVPHSSKQSCCVNASFLTISSNRPLIGFKFAFSRGDVVKTLDDPG
jgi:hypothetical protein